MECQILRKRPLRLSLSANPYRCPSEFQPAVSKMNFYSCAFFAIRGPKKTQKLSPFSESNHRGTEAQRHRGTEAQRCKRETDYSLYLCASPCLRGSFFRFRGLVDCLGRSLPRQSSD